MRLSMRSLLPIVLVCVSAPSLFACGSGAARAVAPDRQARFSPYVDVSLQPPPDFAAASRSAGLRSVTLAFIVAGDHRRCRPVWGGGTPVDSAPLVRTIARMRSLGGDVRASFGGRAGTELASACATSGALASAYRSVVDRLDLRTVDFDIEGASLSDPATVDRRWTAVAALQSARRAARRPLSVQVTLSVSPTGLTADGVAALRRALTNGVVVRTVNLLTMDYGDGPAPAPRGRMATLAAGAATAAHAQLARLWPRRSSAAVWSAMSLTPMIGVNDVADEVFSIADVRSLLAFARGRHLGGLAMWELPRDRPCPPGVDPSIAQPNCSGLAQRSLEFAGVLARFAG